MILQLILSGLVNVASYPMSTQSSELIMALAHHYVPEKKVVKSVIGEMDQVPLNSISLVEELAEDQLGESFSMFNVLKYKIVGSNPL